MKTTVLFTGDVQNDVYRLPVADAQTESDHRSKPHWRSFPTHVEVSHAGGAIRCCEFFAAAAGFSEGVLCYPPSTEGTLCMYPSSCMELKPGSDGAYRVNRMTGFSAPTAPFEKTEESEQGAAPDWIFIEDRANEFRLDPQRWPSCLAADNSRSSIVLRSDRPLLSGELWEHLLSHHAERTTLIVKAGDLRLSGARVSERLSWDSTLKDCVRLLAEHKSFESFRKLAAVVVRFGSDGALRLGFKAGQLVSADFVFDPARSEGDFEVGMGGRMPGQGMAFAAAYLAAILKSSVADALNLGLSASRATARFGFRWEDDVLVSPLAEIFAGKPEGFSSRQYSAPFSMLSDPSWSLVQESIAGRASEVALQAVKESSVLEAAGIPCVKIGNMVTADYREAESYRSVRNLIDEYLKIPNLQCSRPLSIAVFGFPGSGKSFGVNQVAASLGKEKFQKLEFNLSQFTRVEDLAAAFHQVRDVALSGKVPLAFFDEFDSGLGGEELAWLKQFLAPMQDGAFREGETWHPLGRSIFVFAGGTANCFQNFSGDGSVDTEAIEKRRKAKVPDFVSRLRGFVNVGSFNPILEEGETFDWEHFPELLVRRALILRSGFERSYPALINEQGELQIDAAVLNRILFCREFKNGVRSMEALLEMSKLRGAKRFTESCFPSDEQMALCLSREG